jgi:3'-5' exoribonuclease
MDKAYIKDLKVGDSIKWYYVLKNKHKRTARTGKDYLDLTFEDKTGEINGKIWDNTEKISKILNEGKIVFVDALVETYNNNKQLKIQDIREIFEDEISPSSILPSSKENPEDMWKKLEDIIKKEVHNSFLLELIKRISVKYKEQLLNWPGAKKIHHSYVGGLLEHTLSVMEIALYFGGKYSLDKELLVTGSFLHDIGKIKEIKDVNEKSETEEGMLLGHIIIGVQIVKEEAQQIIGFPKELLTLLTHLIISHHGSYDFGSYQVPMTREALALHFADYIDSQMNIFDNIINKYSGDGFASDYDRRIGRKIFLGEKE